MGDRAALVREALATRAVRADVDRLTDEEPLLALGLDSVALIALTAELQQRTGAVIDDEVLFLPDLSIAALAEAIGPGAPAAERFEAAGLGVVAPTGHGVDALWDSLLDGTAHRVPVPYQPEGRHRAGVVPGATDEEITSPGRLLTLLLAAAEQALAEAGVADRTRVHLVVGTTDTGGSALTHAMDTGPAPSGPAFVGNLARRAAAALGLGGSATVIGSASASGAVALGYALEALRSRDADEVLVVGADTVSETGFHGLAALRTLSPDGCRPFSSERRGIAISEAAAAVLLRRTDGPPAPDASGSRGTSAAGGRLVGYGASSLTSHLAAPEAGGIELAVRRALADAGITPPEVSFVNTHGPGTKLGDVAETEALRAVFGDHLPRVPLNSSKGVLWHCQGAAGVIESTVCLLSLARGVITPTFGGEPFDERWAELDIVREPREASPRYALSVSCGLGGVNTALVWERA
ncbi:beta-ketoacyl synthase N-terminal-like domain-containing protein [Streptomyces anulatus]|uniref:beta-ketoacyl synthase N-terminal-like domain-containing protein n=1 Tax=Streptomyces anulatus TaxID=1892 RepID=UPI002E810508|nr:beta-ketoacyl synthase N-terminal-like domain-containing protein [Streptomyces anulatus]WUC87466.1 phosphopantetheine-binding protein [Streptomyces anulatus]